MRSFAELFGSGPMPDFSIRGVDFTSLARGYGVPARRVESPADLAPALVESFGSIGPSLVDVAVDAGARRLF